MEVPLLVLDLVLSLKECHTGYTSCSLLGWLNAPSRKTPCVPGVTVFVLFLNYFEWLHHFLAKAECSFLVLRVHNIITLL